MHWILQSNIYSEDGWKVLVETLERFSIPYSVHKIVPFVGELLPFPELHTDNVICMGAYSMRHTAKKENWYPGVFDLEPFTFEVQLSHWGEHMLNHDSVVCELQDAVFTDEEMFIRPIEDSKSFSGMKIHREDFRTWQKQICVLEYDFGNTVDKHSKIQLAKLKNIYAEYRYWIVDGEIVTSSMYKLGYNILYKPGAPERFDTFVRERIAEYQPLRAFVIDVCDCEEGIKIVEINTLNSSGFYAGDIQKLVFTLEEKFNKE